MVIMIGNNRIGIHDFDNVKTISITIVTAKVIE